MIGAHLWAAMGCIGIWIVRIAKHFIFFSRRNQKCERGMGVDGGFYAGTRANHA